MAFMEKLRQNVFGVFGTIILFIILIVFLWGDASRGTNKLNRDAIIAGSVNGEDITYAEFNQRVEEMTAQQKQSNPEAEINTRQIQEQVWESMVTEKLIEQGAARMGVDVSDEQLRDILLNDPPQQFKSWFTDSTGQFMQGEYLSLMTNMEGFFAARQIQGKQAEDIRNQILEQTKRIRLQHSYMGLQNIIGALYPASPTIMESKYELQNSKASGSFIYLNANMIPDAEVKVTDDEAKKYYDEHKGIFTHKASRTVRYAMLRMGPSAQDSAKVQTRFRRYTQEVARGTTPESKDSIFGSLAAEFGTQLYTGATYTPEHELQPELKALLTDSAASSIIGPVRISGKLYYVNVVDARDTGETWMKAQHILFRTMPGPDSVAQDDSLKAVAEGIAAKARSGADFAELAKEHSQDNSAQSGGDVGWFSAKSNFVQEFKDAALPASVGQIVGPVKTQFGYHIIKVTEKSKREYKLRAINFDVLVSSTTKNLLRRQAEELRTRLEKGENFDSAAAALHLQVLEQTSEQANRPIATSYALGQFAYSGDVGSVSSVIKLPDEALIVAQISKITPAGIPEFDEVKDQVIGTVRLRKKVEMLKTKADQIRGLLTPSDSLSKALTIDSTLAIRDFVDQAKGSPFPDVGFDANLSSALFKLKAGEISAPIRGQSGYFIVKATTVTVPNESQFKQEKKEFQKQFLTQQRQALFNQWLEDERSKATLERNWDR